MNPVLDIVLQTTEILTLLAGFAGAFVSVLLLFHPLKIRRWSALMNLSTPQRIVPLLNRNIRTGELTGRHPKIFGALFAAVSALLLAMLFLRIRIEPLPDLFDDILVETLVLTAKVAGFSGLVLGMLMMAAPEAVRRIEKRMDTWFDTEIVSQALDAFHPQIDSVFLRYPRLFGSVGLLASFLLIVLSVANLQR